MLLVGEGLHKRYTTARGEIHAVAGIDVQVAAGEFLAICGRSGSGKSTLLGMLGGLCRPTAGTVRLDGTDLASLGARALAELRAKKLGFMFQFAGLLTNLRAVDNIALPALLAGADYADAYARARDLLGQVGLADRWDAHASELSGGQQRRVALARALVNRPILLLADEPTSDLDEEAEREMLALLAQLRKTCQTALIVVTHDPEVARQADRIITLRNGQLAATTLPTPAAPVPLLPSVPAVPEAPAPALSAGEPTILGAGFRGGVIAFVGWTLMVAALLWGIDFATAWFQTRALASKQETRKIAQDLALQQLRANIDDVQYLPDGGYEASLFLQNADVSKPFYVLGPSVRIFVQNNRSWQEVPVTAGDGADNRVQEVRSKTTYPIRFRADLARFDELLKGYMHIRITNVMIVSASTAPDDEIFQRTDDYYVYLKPQSISDAEVRQRNRWKDTAHVPRWIGMPSH